MIKFPSKIKNFYKKNKILILLVFIGFLWLDYINIKTWRFDDSFFGYTYAQNLSEGKGFTFNGNKIIGTSAPLPVILYSSIKIISNLLRVNISIQQIAENISILAIIISSVFLFKIIKNYTKSDLISFVGGFLLYSNLFYLMTFGHESILAILLILFSILLTINKKYILSIIVIGLAFLCRAESLTIIPFIFFEIYKNDKKIFKLIKYFLLLLIPISIWEIFSLLYFKQSTSNSFAFKMYQAKIDKSNFIGSLFNWININLNLLPNNFNWFTLSISFLGILFCSGSILILILCLLVIPIIFYSIINIEFYHWFLFLLPIPMILGISIFLLREKSNKIVFTIISIILIFSSIKTTKNFQKQLPYARDSVYTDIGKYLNENSKNSDSFAFMEIGQIAYLSKIKIIDITGITTPNVLNKLKNSDNCYPYDFYKPEYILYDPLFKWLTDPTKCNSIQDYFIVKEFNSTRYRTLYLYKHN